jgi:hypothetical protein
MKPIRAAWLGAAVLASFLATGIPYWRVPYHHLTLPNALWHPGLVVPVAAAFLLCRLRVASILATSTLITLSIVAVVWIRIQMETSRDPTSHNLWPLEIAIALGIALVCAWPAAGAGRLLATASQSRGGAHP